MAGEEQARRSARKLIEVSLPLDAIDAAAAREKSIRHGHPSTLHLWWARRPLAAARAVIFAALIDDPSAHPERFPTEEAQRRERERLFDLLRRLVVWEHAGDAKLLAEASEELRSSLGGELPLLVDPFAGGGAIPLEGQRLGLRVEASDLNPVAVLINRALLELPWRFRGRAPVHPEARASLDIGPHASAPAAGLAADVRAYGTWMLAEARRRLRAIYPPAALPEGGTAAVVAWLWARTARCVNPACGIEAPLVRSFVLSEKPGREHWVRPELEGNRVRFHVERGQAPTEYRGGTVVSGRGGRCVACGTLLPFAYVREEGQAGRLGLELLAIVADGARGKRYLDPDPAHEEAARVAVPADLPETLLPGDTRAFGVPLYGLTRHVDLFLPRQLVLLDTLAALVREARAHLLADGAEPDYADAVATYLGLMLGRVVDRSSSLCSWDKSRETVRNTFARQALPMVWDLAEANVLGERSGSFSGAIEWVAKVLENLPARAEARTLARDAVGEPLGAPGTAFVVTDPPYYDNIGYADLADLFYVLLRRALHDVDPDLFATVLTPKEEELIASPYRAGSREEARRRFEERMEQAFGRMREAADPSLPLVVFYAYKQREERDGEQVSTGWETMLGALVRAGLQVTATWPLRTELANRQRSQQSNALASSIALVCRARPEDAPTTERRSLRRELAEAVAAAVRELQASGISPVDLAQAVIGPGMAVYSRYARVLEPDGTPMSVRSALVLINEILDETLVAEEAGWDEPTRFALRFFDAFGFGATRYGEADNLARSLNIGVARLEEAGILEARQGTVRLRAAEELARLDANACARVADASLWGLVHVLIAELVHGGGEEDAQRTLEPRRHRAESVRELAYRLFLAAERRDAALAGGYNALGAALPGMLARLGEGAAGGRVLRLEEDGS